MSWKPEVFVEGKWSQNGLVFATEGEASASACDLFNRWFCCEDHRAVEVPDDEYPVNYRIENGVMSAIHNPVEQEE